MNNRVEHIDIAKGISITLVALVHSKLASFFPEIIDSMSLFRMPLFFFLSGVFFSFSTPPKLFILKKSEALLKPYFSVLLLLFVIDVIFQNDNLLLQLQGIFYGNGETLRWVQMWFLTHLFTVYCFSYVLFRFTHFNLLPLPIKMFVLMLLLLLGGLYVDTFWLKEITIAGKVSVLPGLPFSIDILLISSSFFISGYLMRNKIIGFSPHRYLFVFACFIFVCIIFLTKSYTDLNKRIYETAITASIGAISGIYIVMCISVLLVKHNAFKVIFQKLGAGSLFILIFHYVIHWKVYTFISSGDINYSIGLVFAVVAFILSVSLPLLIQEMVYRNNYLALFFLPFKSNKLFTRKLTEDPE
ncbi:acyltransferase family protein [Shewanella sp. 6_MG-2023]|uniref:acyltransferase family protein n=1 Tax=Shewanella sp. 6_MG-2023 TaxID=3062660 RepID=UPI0026E251FE|nr:acyltransferase family protein [Shewanella sp. 6_MG-2023]MDO6621179.1 acyltransferase family protein [Shewanella sp. 6_MG-2023]